MRIALLKGFSYSYIQNCSTQVVVALCKEYIHYNFVFFCKAGKELTSTYTYCIHSVFFMTLVLTTFEICRMIYLVLDALDFCHLSVFDYLYYYKNIDFLTKYILLHNSFLIKSFRNQSCKQLIVSTKYCKHCMFSIETDPFFPILYHLWLHVSKGWDCSNMHIFIPWLMTAQ